MRLRSVALLALAVSVTLHAARFRSGNIEIEIDSSGNVTVLRDPARRVNHMLPGKASPLLRLQTFDKQDLLPHAAKLSGSTLQLSYASGLTADVAVTRRPHYVVFELTAVSDPSKVEKAVWGPYHVGIDETVGTAVGVVRDREYAIGLQSLNIKTVGGYETEKRNRYGNVAENIPNERGSRLQAFTRNRTVERLANWDEHRGIRAIPVAGETVVGSKIALFGCPPDRVLPLIGDLEVREGLPHPMIDGKWVKISPKAIPSKFMVNWNESNIDDCIAMAKAGGIDLLYSMTAIWESWGHFEFNKKAFPNGVDGVRSCVRKAAAQGIMLGAHSLTNFTTPNDPYIGPVPHPQLSVQGVTKLAASIDAAATEIALGGAFNAEAYRDPPSKRPPLRTVRIGNELIAYERISDSAPYRLLGCRRGEHGTTPASHAEGDEVGRLVTHPYNVYFPDIRLLPEMARNLARAFNRTGMKVVSLDGHEGGALTGHELYGEELFAKTFWDALEDKTVINTSSELHHYHWHMVSNLSWGEPQANTFRGAMLDYRLGRLEFLRLNYIPRKLGQYRFTPKQTVADMEWVMARAAGFDAGVDIYITPAQVKANPAGEQILAKIKLWLTAIREGAFTEAQKEQLRDPSQDFTLDRTSDGKWVLRNTGKSNPSAR